LRFGIGNEYPKGMQVDYVLGEWTESELPLVRLKIEGSVKAIEDFVTKGINLTMNEVNNLEFRL